MKYKFFAFAAITVLAAACTSEVPEETNAVKMIELSPAASRAAEQNAQFKYHILEGANVSTDADRNVVISPLCLSMGLTAWANRIDDEIFIYESDIESRDRLFQLLGSHNLESLNEITRTYATVIPNLEDGTTSDIFNLIYEIKGFTDGNGTIDPFFDRDAFAKDSTIFADILRADVICAPRDSMYRDSRFMAWMDKYGLGFDAPRGLIKPHVFNFVHFKGSWSDKFDPELTRKSTFHGADGDCKVDMMYQSDDFDYAENAKLRVLKKPFGNGTFEMVLVLPNGDCDIYDIVNYDDLHVIDGMVFSKVWLNLSVPKFDFNTGFQDANTWLRAIGIVPRVSGPDMVPGYPSTAWVDFSACVKLGIDENGAEVKANTETRGVVTCAGPLDFVCDRPFLLMINVAQTGASFVAAKIVSMK